MKKVLIVDNDIDTVNALDIILKEIMCEIEHKTNTIEIINILYQTHADLLILNWDTQINSGCETLTLIRNNKDFDYLPIFVISELALNPNVLKQIIYMGVIDVIKKPLNSSELNIKINNIFKIIDNRVKDLSLEIEKINKTLSVNNAKIKDLENKLLRKDRELILYALNVLQNKKFISNFKNDIYATNMKFDYKQQIIIKKIFSKYESFTNSLNWDIFEKRFVELNYDFYKNLITEFPTLTWGEILLCSLFKIGLSPKEIVSINYSNYDAVRKALYRIRKKIGIDSSVDICIFMQKY